ncbi:hypothetical protein [Prosthecobacter dejongeii]|uniref:DUF2786 domain-containing protein n=1 Tax=Prosthecobacter dejongeii TaxID=48465 RepID=A0A7W7YQC6_9BACT|nr:hypothetical protein [Prosthecobacter dejongeii]MBB5040289.1 hypothetical protein [Prosthecobacter dejongeii]
MSEKDLLEKLRKIERLYAGAATAGEKMAAADALARIQKRLNEAKQKEAAIEYKFTLTDDWSKKLFVALLRRYSLKPYRYARQRRTTVMVRVPVTFVDQTLWPEFLELSAVLKNYLDEMTERVIHEAIHEDDTDTDVLDNEWLE